MPKLHDVLSLGQGHKLVKVVPIWGGAAQLHYQAFDEGHFLDQLIESGRVVVGSLATSDTRAQCVLESDISVGFNLVDCYLWRL